MQAAVDAQQQVLSGLQGELQHRLAVALAARAAASNATNQAAQAKAIAAAKVEGGRRRREGRQGGGRGREGGVRPQPQPRPQHRSPAVRWPHSLPAVDGRPHLFDLGARNGRYQAECIAQHESGDDPNNRNPSSGSAGLFQLMPFWWDGNNQFGWRFDPYDAQQNAIHAHLIWERDGWTPWTTMHFCA